MKDFDSVHFYPSSEIFEKAAHIFEEEKKTIQTLIQDADIQHVGSCAIPGAWGKFDIDIQIRVLQDQFEFAKSQLQKRYDEKHREKLWTSTFAIFKAPEGSPYDIDYLLTVMDSPEDDFYLVRDYFISHPEALEEYNALKQKHEGQPYHEYRSAKQAFLGPNGETRFLI